MKDQIVAAVLNVVTTNQIHAVYHHHGLFWPSCCDFTSCLQKKDYWHVLVFLSLWLVRLENTNSICSYIYSIERCLFLVQEFNSTYSCMRSSLAKQIVQRLGSKRVRQIEIRNQEWGYSTLCAAKLTGLGKPSLALDTPLVQILQVKYVPGSTFTVKNRVLRNIPGALRLPSY